MTDWQTLLDAAPGLASWQTAAEQAGERSVNGWCEWAARWAPLRKLVEQAVGAGDGPEFDQAMHVCLVRLRACYDLARRKAQLAKQRPATATIRIL